MVRHARTFFALAMKKILFLSLMMLLAPLFTLRAQEYSPRLEFSRGDFYYGGNRLSDAEIFHLIGEDVFYATYQGATRQRNAGQSMMIAGGVTFGVGIASLFMGLALSYNSQDYPDGNYYTISSLVPIGYAAAIAGGIVLDAGIPLFIIGNSRLNWIERDFNRRNHSPYACVNVGGAPHGFGLTVNF